MFESWDGALICVQVVRVPLVASMSPELIQEALAQTLLTKVVKSQAWLRASRTVPQDFIIFCWLPFTISDSVAEATSLLMQRVRELDPRFSHRLRVPAEPGSLFPAQFAHISESQRRSRKAESSRAKSSLSESDICGALRGAMSSGGDICAFSTACYESDDEDGECTR